MNKSLVTGYIIVLFSIYKNIKKEIIKRSLNKSIAYEAVFFIKFHQ